MNLNSLIQRPLQSARIPLIAVALLLMLTPAPAWAWGCDGHQAVAMIAEKHMNPRARLMATQLLLKQPIDPGLFRFCSSAGVDMMADSATWADDIRKSRPEASGWHYIDIPRGAPRSAVSNSCPAFAGCVTGAIQKQIEVLRSDADPRTRADALRFLIHFVGDLHQPMHCTTNNDMGGNCLPIIFFGNPPNMKTPETETYSPNLHSLWDSTLILRIKGWEPVTQWADSIDREFSSQAGRWQNAGIDVDGWAWESHELAESMAYGKLSVADRVEKPARVTWCGDDNHVSLRLLQLHEQVSQPYVDAVAPTIKEQIAKAGVRLAMILNQIWP